MAERLADLNKDFPNIRFLSIPVDIDASYGWGTLYYGQTTYDTGINLTGKMLFTSFIGTNKDASLITRVTGTSTLNIMLFRAVSGTNITGTVNVMIVG